MKKTTDSEKPDWHAIKRAYFGGEGSLRVLSKKFGVPCRTLERRASREHWRLEVTKLGGVVTAAAVDAATERGQQLGLTAAEFNSRAIRLIGQVLDRIDEFSGRETISGGELRQVSGALRDAVTVGRATFGLDNSSPMNLLNIHVTLRHQNHRMVEPSKPPIDV